jgi:hypothetical protein
MAAALPTSTTMKENNGKQRAVCRVQNLSGRQIDGWGRQFALYLTLNNI